MYPDGSSGRPLRVALYARVSTRDKDQDPELQLVPLRDYVAARGWVATEYTDQASAADLVRRTAWHRLLEDARRRRVDRVLVWKLDRAFRSTLHALRTLEELDGWGVGFEVLTQPIDTSTPMGRLIFAVLAAVAEMERSLIADRVREGMAHARRQGKQIGRPRVEARRGFRTRWAEVEPQVRSGAVSRRAAAAQLGIGQGTLARLLAEEAGNGPSQQMTADPNGSFEAAR